MNHFHQTLYSSSRASRGMFGNMAILATEFGGQHGMQKGYARKVSKRRISYL